MTSESDGFVGLVPRRVWRMSGVLYLVIIVCGVAGEVAVRGPLVDAGDALGTARSVAAASGRFRASMLMDVAMALSDVGLGVLLYVALEPVSRLLSLLALCFRLVQAAILGMGLLHLQQAVALATGGDVAQAQAVLGAIEAHAVGYDLALFFFAVHCAAMGALLWRGRVGPRLLGPMMGAAGAVYFVGSTLRVAMPEQVEAFAAAYGIPLLAESWFCGWLLLGRVPEGAVQRAEPR